MGSYHGNPYIDCYLGNPYMYVLLPWKHMHGLLPWNLRTVIVIQHPTMTVKSHFPKTKCWIIYFCLTVWPINANALYHLYITLMSHWNLKDQALLKSSAVFRCQWKGKPCKPTDIKPTVTDMGICYTFHTDQMFVEQAGRSANITPVRCYTRIGASSIYRRENPSWWQGKGRERFFFEREREREREREAVLPRPLTSC